MLPFSVHCEPPFLVATFDAAQETLGWAMTRAGFQTARHVAWLQVRDADLPVGVDPHDLLEQWLADAGLSGALAMMTARDVRRHHVAQARVGDVVATCLTTIGLVNGERVGERCSAPEEVAGTINTLVHISQPLTEAAFIEAMSIVVQARTLAVVESGVRRNGVAITGTGTDCIIMAAPAGADRARYAGLHTDIGEAVGAAVLDAMRDGIAIWTVDVGAKLPAEITVRRRD